MSKSKRPAQGGPITFPVCDLNKSARANDSAPSADKSTGIAVALYRFTPSGIEYYDSIVSSNSATSMILQSLPVIFELGTGTPKLNARSLDQLGTKFQKAVAAMQMGILGDVRLFFPIEAAICGLGFHRAPVAADRWIESIQIIAMNRFGHLREMRAKPSAEGMEQNSAVFGMEGVHHV